jgi:peptidoglycan/xylan/chitin deacetylase (PgdA/CDA1 family)
MTWAEAHEMAGAGMQFGSHTETHQVLSGASADEVWNEVTSSRKTIENALGNRCWTFSYPNGERADFRTSDMEMLRRAGYECAFSQVPGLIDSNDDVFALRRVPVPSSPSPLVFQSRATGLHGILTMARRTEST